MIILAKEIKAFTVLENTSTTFKMEVEINTVSNIDITVNRTNNNKVTATNKQGERIIVLPYLVIEAKQLADDNKPKINLTKTNFDYHKYGKKQVLTNDENTNKKEGNEMENKFFTNEEAVEVIVGYIKNNLESYETIDVSDLHNDVFDSDYYIIGTYQAEKALEQYGVFSALGEIQEYEKNNFGEVYTDLSDAEKVANMLWYIIGEQTMVELGLYDLDNPTVGLLLVEIENNQ